MTPTSQQIQALKTTLLQLAPLPEKEGEALTTGWQSIEFKRKALITAAGEVERYLYFVCEGVQRAFYLEGNKDATLMFAYTGSFSGILDSLFLQQPSRYYLETLSNSVCLRMPYAHLKGLMNNFPAITQWVHISTVYALSGVMERHMQWQTLTAEDKFRTLLTRSPHLLNLISHKYLASYLGIDPATFSKLLGTIKL